MGETHVRDHSQHLAASPWCDPRGIQYGHHEEMAKAGSWSFTEQKMPLSQVPGGYIRPSPVVVDADDWRLR